MGLLRLYLALCVFHDHVNSNAPRMFLSSSVAVCIFFIISGFYMSLVINENYKNQNNGIISFYINRFLRLYPIYIIILLTFGIVFKKFLNIDLYQFNDIWWLIKQLLIFPEVVINNFNLKPDTTFLIFGQMYTVGLEFIFSH